MIFEFLTQRAILVGIMDETMEHNKQTDQNKNAPVPIEEISWTAPEYNVREKSRGWFLSVAIISGAGILLLIILENILFAVFLVLALFLLFVYQIRTPRKLQFSITKRGVVVHNRLFEYIHLQSFWIFQHENGENELSLISKKTVMPLIKLPLGEMDPDEIRKALAIFIPEKPQEESLIDVIARRIGF